MKMHIYLDEDGDWRASFSIPEDEDTNFVTVEYDGDRPILFSNDDESVEIGVNQ